MSGNPSDDMVTSNAVTNYMCNSMHCAVTSAACKWAERVPCSFANPVSYVFLEAALTSNQIEDTQTRAIHCAATNQADLPLQERQSAGRQHQRYGAAASTNSWAINCSGCKCMTK